MSDRTRRLLNAIDKLAVWGAIGIIILLIISYFWMGMMIVGPQKQPTLDLIKSMLMTLSVSLIPIFILFIGSYILLRNIQKIKDEERRENLIKDVAQLTSITIEEQLKHLSLGNHWLSHKNLTDALITAFQYVNNPKVIRIYAFSTYVIQPVIRDLNINCQECRLLLYHSNSIDLKKLHEDPSLNLIPIDEWCHMKASGFIENLDIRFHQFYPSEYFVILEDRALIHGNYLIQDNRFPKAEVQEPIYVSDETSIGKILIRKYLQVFESLRKSKHVQEVNSELISINSEN